MIKTIIQEILLNDLLWCLVAAYFLILLWWLKFQRKLNLKWQFASVLSLVHLIVAVVVMRLWAILEVGGNLEEAASLRLYGGVFIVPILYYIGARFTKQKITLVMDIAIVGGVIGLFFGRMNCLIAGCCQGALIVPNEPWRWPIRELELLYYVVFIIYYAPKVLRGKTYGQVCPVLFISYGTMRFVFEWVRVEFTTQVGVFHLAHIWSLIAIVVGTGIYIKLRKDLQKSKTTPKKTQSLTLAKGGNKQ